MGKASRNKAGRKTAVTGPAPDQEAVPASTGGRVLTRLGGLVEARWFLPAVLVLAALLRLGHVAAIYRAPWLEHLQLDHRIYDEWGQRIAGGAWVGRDAFFVDPLYAYFLGIIYWTFGHRIVVVLVIQALLGVAICYLTNLLGKVLFGRKLAHLAALAMAVYLPAIYYEALVEKTALSLFLFLLSLVLYLRGRRRHITLAAVTLGLAALTRGNFLIFIPLGALALLLRTPAERDPASAANGPRTTRRPPSWSARIRLNGEIAGRFLLVSFVVVSVAVIRNSVVAGVTSTTTNMGQNLYIGNYSGNLNGTYSAPTFVRSDPRFEESDFRTEAERRLGRKVRPQQVSAYWRGQAIDEIMAQPGLAVDRMLKKVRLFWHDYEVPDNSNMYLAREDSLVLRLPLLTMGMVFPFALVGAAFSFRRSKESRLLVAIALVYSMGVVAFFILARFRIQILPILVIFAVLGAARLIADALAKRWKWVVLEGSILLSGLVFSAVTPDWIESTKAPNLAISYNNMGVLYADTGREEAAIAAYEKAILLSPRTVVGGMRSVGEIYLRRKNYQKAEVHMLQVLQHKPDSRLGRDALVRLYEAMSREPAHQDDQDIRRKLQAARRNAAR